MPQLQPLPSQDEHSDEDTLHLPTPTMSGEEMRALLRANPESLVRGTGERLVRPADRRITCSASMADAIIEDRG